MQAEELAIDQPAQRDIIKHIGEVLPDIRVSILPAALIIEPIDLGYGCPLVIASEDCDPVGVSHF